MSSDPLYKVIVRHKDGGLAYQDSGDDLEALQQKCRDERERTAKRLSESKAAAMTIAVYRRIT